MNRYRLAALTITAMILLALPASSQTDTLIGKAAPEFDLPTLSGSQNIALEDLRGKIVVLHFGAGWWPFCNAEAPHLEQLWQDYRDRGVQVLVIDVKESREDTETYVKRSKFTFPILMDSDGSVAALYAPPSVLPDLPRSDVVIASNLIIDADGIIRFMSLLDTTSFDARLVALKARLDEMLASGNWRSHRE